jgi:hypothetical protein
MGRARCVIDVSNAEQMAVLCRAFRGVNGEQNSVIGCLCASVGEVTGCERADSVSKGEPRERYDDEC